MREAAVSTPPGAGVRRGELIVAAALEARLQQNAYDRFEDAVADFFGVNRTAMRCLEVLDRTGQLTAGEVARQTGLTSGAVTALLDRLERAGYLRRLRDPADRRRILVELTDQARAAIAAVYGPLTQAMTALERYTDAELELLADFLRTGSGLLGEHAERIRALGAGRAAGPAPSP
jgi:DNA-binding MarR family transcriptional regulator